MVRNGSPAPPDQRQSRRPPRARRRAVGLSPLSLCRSMTWLRRRTTTRSGSRRAEAARRALQRRPERHRARAGRRRLGLPRVARRCARPALACSSARSSVVSLPRQWRRSRSWRTRAVHAPGHRQIRGIAADSVVAEPGRARPDRGGPAGSAEAAGAIRYKTTLCSNVFSGSSRPGGAAAARRPRRRDGRDPRAPRRPCAEKRPA